MTYYTKIDDHFDGGSLDLDIWAEGASINASVESGQAKLHTDGTLSGFARLIPYFTAADGTRLGTYVAGSSVVYEAKFTPTGQRPTSGPVTQYAAWLVVYQAITDNDPQIGFQAFARSGSGSSTVYGLEVVYDPDGNNAFEQGPVVTTFDVNTPIWLRVTVQSNGTVVCEYSKDNSAWTTAGTFANYYSSTQYLNLYLLHNTYNNAGAAADLYVDDVLVKNTEPPVVAFSADTTRGYAPLEVNFTDMSPGTFTAWEWDFGDSGTSTEQNPTHTYSSPGYYTVSLTATDRVGTNTATGTDFISVPVLVETTGTIDITPVVNEPSVTMHDPPPPPPSDWSAVGKEDEKEYIYKVYQADGTYIGVWTDGPKDGLQFTQQINTPGTTTTVQLARSANSSKEVRTELTTEAGDTLTTEDGDSLIVVYETPNSVGEDTDVDLNYNVDVYVHYGEFEELTTQDGITITTEDDEEILVTTGAPFGTRVFSGYIMDYESTYGETTGVTVTLASHGYELSNELIRSGETTTVTYSSTEVGAVVKDILDDNPGTMSYDTASIDATGVTTDLKFQLNTKLEGIETAFGQTDADWYWYGNVADNNVYLKQTSATPDHTFILGKHIKSIAIKRSIESLKNVVYFVGGQTDENDPSTTVFKKYEDATSQSNWRKGLERITDRRYTNATSMQQRAEKTLGRYKDPIYTTPLTITSARYDIESIKLGQTVGFANFGNFIDDVVLQIVSLSYASTEVTVQLGELQERQIDTVAGLDDDLANEQYQNLPTAPS